MRNQNIYNLRKNLRAIVSEKRSISEAAIDLNINRQQLNKYLSGLSTPSLATLSRIADHHRIPVDSFFKNENDFNYIFRSSRESSIIPGMISEAINGVIVDALAAKSILTKYCGAYHRLSVLPNSANKIIKSIVRIYQEKGLTYATMIEVYISSESPFSAPTNLKKFHFLVIVKNGKLYFLDSFLSRRGMFGMVYMDDDFAFGFLLGCGLVSYESGAQEICSVPFILNKLRNDKIFKSDLLACGIFNRDDPRLSEAELLMLSEAQ